MNEFNFACPHCDQHMRVSEDDVGRQFECPVCHHLIRVPPPRGRENDPAYRSESGHTWTRL